MSNYVHCRQIVINFFYGNNCSLNIFTLGCIILKIHRLNTTQLKTLILPVGNNINGDIN